MSGLAQPLAGGSYFLGVSAMLVVPVLFSLRSATTGRSAVHPASSSARDRSRPARGA